MIERAYRVGEALGREVWTQDEAGPYQAIPPPGPSWQPAGQPARQPHEYVRGGTAKLLTLFRPATPATGEVRAQPVERAPTAVRHPWLRQELAAIVAGLPPLPPEEATVRATRAYWEQWREGLTVKATLLQELPPLRVLLVYDNRTGHHPPALRCGLFAHGILPLFTPLGGSWLGDSLGDGRVRPAHPRPARPRRPPAAQRAGDHGLARRHRPRLERRPDAVRLGWQAPAAPLARPAAATRAPHRRRLWRRHPPASPPTHPPALSI